MVVAASDCERVRGGFLTQPVNAASSLAYVVAGLRLARGRRDRRSRVVAGALVAGGIGSFAYHGPAGRAAKRLHDAALAALVASVVITEVTAGRDRWGPRSRLAYALFSAAAAVHAGSRTGGPLCRPDSLLQGHAGWHLGSAAALALWADTLVPTEDDPGAGFRPAPANQSGIDSI